MPDSPVKTRPPRRGTRGINPARFAVIILVLMVTAVIAAALIPTGQWVAAGGHLVTQQHAEVFSPRAGTIESWLIQDGDRVEKGQPLLRLEPAQPASAAPENQEQPIHAPIAGTIFLHDYTTGEPVQAQALLAQVFDTAQWVVRLKVNERDLPLIQVGQEVKVSLSAYPPRRFGYARGNVTKVHPVVSPQPSGDGIVYLEAAVTDFGNLEPRPGLTADAWVHTGDTTWLYRLAGWR